MSSRMSIWSVLPPRDAECDVFAPEIAKWMSLVLGKEISPNLLSELESGDVLCELFVKLCPEMKFGKYHKGAKLDLWKRDNIQVFANATLRLGVPKSALISYSFFESKNMAMLITSLLVFVKVLMEKKSASELNLPDSFLKTICSAYLETRVLHQPHTTPSIPAEPNESSELKEPSTSTSQASDSAVVDEVNSLVEQAEQSQLSPEEIRQLDEMMRSQVNDMLEDILKDRRKTCGMWEEEEEEVLKEGESDDSFDEKYLPRSSASLGSKEELSVEESPNENAEESPNENAEKAEKAEENAEKNAEKTAEEAVEKETKKEEEKRSPFMQLERCDDAMMMELMGMDLPEEEEEIIADAIVNAMSEKMEEKPEKEPKKEAEQEPKKEAEKEPKMEAELEPKKDAEEEEVLKEVDDGEEKKPKKSSGFWWKSTLLAAAVATVVVAKHFQK